MCLVLSAIYLSPRWGLDVREFRCIYTPAAPPGLLEAGAQCAPYKLYFSNRFLKRELSSRRFFYFPPSCSQTLFRGNIMWAAMKWNPWPRNGNVIKMNG